MGKNQDPDPGCSFRNHCFGLKCLKKFFDAEPGSGMEKIRIRDAGRKKILIRDAGWNKLGSGINIPDPQHWKKSRDNVPLSILFNDA